MDKGTPIKKRDAHKIVLPMSMQLMRRNQEKEKPEEKWGQGFGGGVATKKGHHKGCFGSLGKNITRRSKLG